MSEKKPLGWREWIGFPDLRIPRVKAKIDTGARTSALHAFMVEPFERDGHQWVRFAIHPVQGDTDTVIETEAPLKDRRVVRDSGGHEELRYVIETRIAIGDDTFVAEVTLTDRDSMRFRALLGRTALKTNYVIHPGKSYIQSKIVDRQESQKS
tara:strand:- start:14127 stop:14585 length:459 start_codon:yes stop_codon:yes gene_type:complete